MEAIIDFIFSNFIIVLIIIGGITKLLGGDGKEQQTNRQGRPIEKRQQTTPSPRNTNRSRSQQPTRSKTSSPLGETISIGEEQQKQLEQLAGQMRTEAVQSFDDLSKEVASDDKIMSSAVTRNKTDNIAKKDRNKNKKEVKRQMKKKLSRQGVTESIIMAEVLGPPRARKPYKSVIAERNN